MAYYTCKLVPQAGTRCTNIISDIKMIREIFGLGLKPAKDIVDSMRIFGDSGVYGKTSCEFSSYGVHPNDRQIRQLLDHGFILHIDGHTKPKVHETKKNTSVDVLKEHMVELMVQALIADKPDVAKVIAELYKL